MPTDLPFVGTTAAKSRLQFWTLAARGDFTENTRLGAEMAQTYLKFKSESGELPSILPQIVIDMTASDDIDDAVRGQLVGFFSYLDHALTFSHPLKK